MTELFSYGSGSIRDFFKKNLNAILYTIILHLFVAIILVFTKVDGLRHDKELGVMLDFTEEKTFEELLAEEEIEVPAEWIEQVFEARRAASNQAVNVNDLEKEEISTEDFVNDLLNELEAEKDEEFLKNREKWEEILSSKVYEEEKPMPVEEEQQTFVGPTTISYEFLEAPLERQKRFLSVPVYRCEGAGNVTVEILVAQNGSVLDAEVIKTQSASDPTCFSEAARNAALNSLFKSDYAGPEKHKARIIYQFVAQ